MEPSPKPPAQPEPPKPVERLFPFVLRARLLLVGAEALQRGKGKLHFVLVTNDLAEGSLNKILENFADYPIVRKYVSADLEKWFGVHNAKVLGFRKSTLAQSIYAELKASRINAAKNPGTAPANAPKPPMRDRRESRAFFDRRDKKPAGTPDAGAKKPAPPWRRNPRRETQAGRSPGGVSQSADRRSYNPSQPRIEKPDGTQRRAPPKPGEGGSGRPTWHRGAADRTPFPGRRVGGARPSRLRPDSARQPRGRRDWTQNRRAGGPPRG
jgi:hypothetical protein